MENKINVAELLKDCPKGMELDCYLFNGLEFDHIDTDNENYPIVCRAKDSSGEYYGHTFTKYGWYTSHYDYAKCVIFPKGKTTWEGFIPPCKFKDGDIIFTRTSDFHWVSIFKGFNKNECCTYIDLCLDDSDLLIDTSYVCNIEEIITQRLVTEEKKEKLFDAIKNNGYKWNPDNKSLEKLVKPKFKVGDKIRHKESGNILKIAEIDMSDSVYCCGLDCVWIVDQDKYELIPDKFDITTLVPFESKVLVRDYGHALWQPSWWGIYDKEHMFPYITLGSRYKQCIPYEGNEHLLGTANKCDEYFKTWK